MTAQPQSSTIKATPNTLAPAFAFRKSLKYKMLHLVFIQALFFVLALATLWLINPNWVTLSQVQTPHAEAIKNFKHHYGMLSTLNLQLANTPPNDEALLASLGSLADELVQHSRTVQAISQKTQQQLSVDFSVLVSFLFNYQNKIKNLAPTQAGYTDRLWEIQLYFSRIQSEFFYILEEVDRADAEALSNALKNTRASLLILTMVSLVTLAFSTLIALRHANQWKLQIAALLNQLYRLSVGNFNHDSKVINSDDELGFLAKTFTETLEHIKKQKGA